MPNSDAKHSIKLLAFFKKKIKCPISRDIRKTIVQYHINNILKNNYYDK